MNSTFRFRPEQAGELPQDMQQLASAIAQLPNDQRAPIETMFQRVAASTCRRRRILNLVQEALSQLRLDMKYLVFDLEATRRERDQFRRGLDAQNGAGDHGDHDSLDDVDD